MPLEKKLNAEPIRGYRLLEPLGSGGFGEVWKCEAPGGIFKAIKFVYGDLNGLSNDSIRAEEELRAVQHIKSIRHPFLLSMDRVESVAGELVIVTEQPDAASGRSRAHDGVVLDSQVAGTTHDDEIAAGGQIRIVVGDYQGRGDVSVIRISDVDR